MTYDSKPILIGIFFKRWVNSIFFFLFLQISSISKRRYNRLSFFLSFKNVYFTCFPLLHIDIMITSKKMYVKVGEL